MGTTGILSTADPRGTGAIDDLFIKAQRPQGGSGISKEEADHLKHDLDDIRRVARQRQAQLDALDTLREQVATRWLEKVGPQAMSFIQRAKTFRQSASSPDRAGQAEAARGLLAEADRALTQGNDYLMSQCTDGFADSGKALTLYGHLSTLISQTRAEVASTSAAIDLSEEQKKSEENVKVLTETLAALRATSDQNNSAQRELIGSLTRNLEAGQERQKDLEAHSQAAELARAAQHEEVKRANAQMQATMDEMASAQVAARAGINSRSMTRRPSGQSRSVSLRGPSLRRTPVTEAARDIASRLVDAVPSRLLAQAAAAAVSHAEVAAAIEATGQSSKSGDAGTLLALYLREPGQGAAVWAEPHRLARVVLASLTALIAQMVTAHPPQQSADLELWALQVRRNMTCGETPLGRAIDQCLAALRRAESIVEADAEEGSDGDDRFVDLGRAGSSNGHRRSHASR